jgi:hypothetical protein
LAFVFRLGALSAMARRVYAWIEWSPRAMIPDETAHTASRSAAQRRISDRPQTAGGSRQSQRLDSASTAVGEGDPIAQPQDRQALHIQKGRLSSSLARTGHPCLLWICKNSKKSRG